MSDVTLGIALGLLGGVVAWGLVQLFLRPRLRTAVHLSKTANGTQPCGFGYRLKIKNASFIRSMTDLRLTPMVRFRHAEPQTNRRVWKRITLQTQMPDLSILRARDHLIAHVFTGTLSAETAGQLVDWGYADAAAPERTLEDLLALPDAYFVFRVIACDGWTGSQYSLESPRLKLGDVTPQGFVLRRSRIDRWVAKASSWRIRMANRWHRSVLVGRMNPELGRGMPPAVEPDADEGPGLDVRSV